MITEAVILFIIVQRGYSSVKAHQIMHHLNSKQVMTLLRLLYSKNIMMHHQLYSKQYGDYHLKIITQLENHKLITHGKHLTHPKHHFYSGILLKLEEFRFTRAIIKSLVHHHKVIYWHYNHQVYRITEMGFHVAHLEKHTNRYLYKTAIKNNKKINDLVPKKKHLRKKRKKNKKKRK